MKLSRNDFILIRIFSFLFLIILWESFNIDDPILHYGGIFIGLLVVGTLVERLEPFLIKESEQKDE